MLIVFFVIVIILCVSLLYIVQGVEDGALLYFVSWFIIITIIAIVAYAHINYKKVTVEKASAVSIEIGK
jgi:hypothetical protein